MLFGCVSVCVFTFACTLLCAQRKQGCLNLPSIRQLARCVSQKCFFVSLFCFGLAAEPPTLQRTDDPRHLTLQMTQVQVHFERFNKNAHTEGGSILNSTSFIQKLSCKYAGQSASRSEMKTAPTEEQKKKVEKCHKNEQRVE